ncbi:glutamate racemase [Deinococcus lacus]|uniref:Glutamate racemase n=1 Tax=Deinococcus lacus TaxID=392561 RepID=A0ABW1YBH0_9DEIO
MTGVRAAGMGTRPLGVFDSGLGGLSVLAELRRAMPEQDFVYLADTAHLPYGERSEENIRALTEAAVRHLYEIGCSGVVVACNTASAYGLSHLRATFPDWPVVGLVPAIKPATLHTRTGRIGVMATPATLRGSRLREAVQEFADPRGVQVMLVTSPRLVPLVEAGAASSPATRRLLRTLLTPLAQAGADQLVLGCTHYPFLAGSIAAEFPGAFSLIDSGAAVAWQTRRLLQERGGGGGSGQLEFLTTGEPERLRPVLERLWAQAQAGAGHTEGGVADTLLPPLGHNGGVSVSDSFSLAGPLRLSRAAL